MKLKRHSPEQIIRKLREAERMLELVRQRDAGLTDTLPMRREG